MIFVSFRVAISSVGILQIDYKMSCKFLWTQVADV